MDNKPAVLLVEDEAGLRELYEEELNKAGFLVFAVANGEEALAIIKERKVASVILDIMLPGMSGLDVLAKMRSEEATKETPVYLLTALEDTDDRARGISLGATEYLAKNEVSPEDVIAKIKSTSNAPTEPTESTSPTNSDQNEPNTVDSTS